MIGKIEKIEKRLRKTIESKREKLNFVKRI
jgi:hypothetical protein